MQKGFTKTALFISLLSTGTILHAEAAEKTVLNKPKGASETELLLLKELAKMNSRLDQLSNKVVQLEKEKQQWKASQAKAAPVKVVPVQTKTPAIKAKSKSQGMQFAALDNQLLTTRTDALPIYTQPNKPEVGQVVVETKVPVNYKTLKYVTPPPILDKDSPVSYLYLDRNYYNISPDQLNRTKYFQIINQNSPQSTAFNNLCIKNALCFSALANFDMRYYDRKGGLDSFGPTLTPSLIGVGVRPLFSSWDKNVVGSINNANLFIDGYVNPYVSAHMNLAYVNGSVKSRTYAHNDPDWQSVYRNAAAVKMDEVYGTFLIPQTPFYARIGRQYLNFGDYKPYPLTESLTQLLTQIRTGGIVGGFVLPNGIYASANYSMARESLDNLSNYLIPIPNPDGNKDRNFGGKIGFTNNFNELFFDVNASYIYDIRDSDYLNANGYLYSIDALSLDSLLERGIATNQIFVMHRAPGIAGHADVHWRQFGASGEFATALNRMNPDSSHSRIHSWGLHGNVGFGVFGFPSLADIGYERGYDSQVYQTVVIAPLPPFSFGPVPLGNALPQYRIVGTYSVAVLPGIALSAQWVHDHDVPRSQMGSGKDGNIGILRVSAQL